MYVQAHSQLNSKLFTGRSSNSSKYFGSVDSPEHGPKTKALAQAGDSSERGQAQSQVSGQGDSEHFIKYDLQTQKPLWLLMANTNDKVMMTYEMPSR